MVGSPFGVCGRLPLPSSPDMTPRSVVVLASNVSVFRSYRRAELLLCVGVLIYWDSFGRSTAQRHPPTWVIQPLSPADLTCFHPKQVVTLSSLTRRLHGIHGLWWSLGVAGSSRSGLTVYPDQLICS